MVKAELLFLYLVREANEGGKKKLLKLSSSVCSQNTFGVPD